MAAIHYLLSVSFSARYYKILSEKCLHNNVIQRFTILSFLATFPHTYNLIGDCKQFKTLPTHNAGEGEGREEHSFFL